MARKLLDDFSQIKFSVSATTRQPREHEKNGVDYHFLSKEEFREKIAQNRFLEWEEFYNGSLYGTLKADVESELDKGYFVMLDIDVLGALNVKNSYKDDVLSIFIKPPSLQVLEERLRARGTETDRSLAVRLERAKNELQYADRFDYVVINDDIESAYQEIKEAVQQFIINF